MVTEGRFAFAGGYSAMENRCTIILKGGGIAYSAEA